MVLVSQFFPRLMPFVQGCSEPMAAQALVDSAIQFCDASAALRYDADVVLTTPGQATVDLDIPAEHALVRVLNVQVDGVSLPPTTFDAGCRAPALPAVQRPSSYFVSRDAVAYTLTLLPAPSGLLSVAATLALRPTRTASRLHDDLFDQWVEPVVDGAIARLCVMSGQAFFDPARAAQAAASARLRTDVARREGSFNRIRASQSVRMRPFA